MDILFTLTHATIPHNGAWLLVVVVMTCLPMNPHPHVVVVGVCLCATVATVVLWKIART